MIPASVRLTAYPAGEGPPERFELTVDGTDRILLAGTWPFNEDEIRAACRAFYAEGKTDE